MSKDIDWSTTYGEGTIVCTCDNCHKEEEFDFEDNNPDYRSVQKQLFEKGWESLKISGIWYDFCCEECRNRFVKITADKRKDDKNGKEHGIYHQWRPV